MPEWAADGLIARHRPVPPPGASRVRPFGRRLTVADSLRGAGAELRVGGIVAIGLGAVRLGRAVSVRPAPTAGAVLHTTDGLYRFVRHPIYSGVLLLAAGITVTNGGLFALGVFGALVLVLNVKARIEERLLAERFPGYADYARLRPVSPMAMTRPHSGGHDQLSVTSAVHDLLRAP